jgi:Secretion system C-terminal sorting domain
MRQKITFLLLFISTICMNAQTQFWSDTFEDTGAPSIGTRTPSVAEFSFGGPPATAYFKRTDLAGIALQSGTYSNIQGSKFWAAEDIDKGSTGVNNSISANQQVNWSGINISGKTNISFKGLFAANDFNGSYQGTDWIASSAQDFIAIEYRIDGGAWIKAIGIYSANPNSSNTFSVDTNNDLLGDGTALTYAFTELTTNITGTGTTLDLRFNCFVNATAVQEIAVDNFRLFQDTPLSSNEFINQTKFSLYPNPSSNFIKIKSLNGGDFQLINMLGETIKEFNVKSNIETTVDINGLSEGLYYIKSVSTNNVQKLVIKR